MDYDRVDSLKSWMWLTRDFNGSRGDLVMILAKLFMAIIGASKLHLMHGRWLQLHWEEHGDGIGFLIRSTSLVIESKFYSKVEKKLIPVKHLTVITGASDLFLRHSRQGNYGFISLWGTQWYLGLLIQSMSWDIESKFYLKVEKMVNLAKLLMAITDASELCLRHGWKLWLSFVGRNTTLVSDFDTMS